MFLDSCKVLEELNSQNKLEPNLKKNTTSYIILWTKQADAKYSFHVKKTSLQITLRKDGSHVLKVLKISSISNKEQGYDGGKSCKAGLF